MGIVCVVCGCEVRADTVWKHTRTDGRTDRGNGLGHPTVPLTSALESQGRGRLHLVCCSGQRHAPDVHRDTLHAAIT